ncbi:tRNA nucleotidyltransferase (CCA-adding enzyme) [Carnobacterium iners]|uniref:CCA-adding enzyme n=1 Tax=Carnobacterium iners TaxID=1073423 RepID=A0A1X7NE82_9LACT|nr:CCA tRNA nucleotidyltransferase [Carnobacterium iners]SEK36592.1 tRNA nucleotidyltransferase (CCA-adding enzyme) [Carnobacterium iners]SMH35560.1 tRNA nucleotidyltransferase (CCA-adding enzyme) [Carnobacterium iners]
MIHENLLFAKALPIIAEIKKAGYEVYFVGGCVRDALLNKEINDVDLATSAFPAEIKAIFPKTIDVGIEHGTVMVLRNDETYEVTTFRTESTYQDFRRPDQVIFVRSLKEDLKRRDFTVNALAMTEDGEIIDYFGGVKDLTNGLIKAVGSPRERFFEDALRMMRGVRFVSQLDFSMDSETKKAIFLHRALLEKIAIERIQVEFMKLLLGEGRQKGLNLFVESELYSYCPGLAEYQKELTYFSTLKNKQNHKLLSSLAAWTLLLFILGKQEEDVDSFLRAWKCSKKMIQQVKVALRALTLRVKQPLDKLLLYQSGYAIILEVEELLTFLDKPADLTRLEELTNRLPMKDKKEMAVSGFDLLAYFNKKPGKWLGSALDKIEIGIVLGEITNEKEAILNWLSETNEIKKEDF